MVGFSEDDVVLEAETLLAEPQLKPNEPSNEQQ